MKCQIPQGTFMSYDSLITHQCHRRAVADWRQMTEQQRQCVLKTVFNLSQHVVARTMLSMSTDGNLTATHYPVAGKTLESRQCPCVDRTTTPNKRPKL